MDRSIDRTAGVVLSTAMDRERDAYSGFDAPAIAAILHQLLDVDDGLYVAGLATDYCVRATALDAVNHCFANVIVRRDTVRGVEIRPGDSERALAEIAAAGVTVIPMIIIPRAKVRGRRPERFAGKVEQLQLLRRRDRGAQA